MNLANELRIGNWVQYKDGDISVIEAIPNKDVVCISGLTDSSINGIYELRFLQPIELTEEWLLGFGFKEFKLPEQEDLYGFRFNQFVFLDENQFCWMDGFFSDQENHITFDSKLKYVHQLQNLYFALTGLELELKN